MPSEGLILREHVVKYTDMETQVQHAGINTVRPTTLLIGSVTLSKTTYKEINFTIG